MPLAQVRAVQAMGALAVIVGSSDRTGGLLTMPGTGDTSDIIIPAVYMLYARGALQPWLWRRVFTCCAGDSYHAVTL